MKAMHVAVIYTRKLISPYRISIAEQILNFKNLDIFWVDGLINTNLKFLTLFKNHMENYSQFNFHTKEFFASKWVWRIEEKIFLRVLPHKGAIMAGFPSQAFLAVWDVPGILTRRTIITGVPRPRMGNVSKKSVQKINTDPIARNRLFITLKNLRYASNRHFL